MTIDHEATEGDGGKSVQSQPSNRYSEATLSVSVEAELDALGVWHVDVYVNGEGVGGGPALGGLEQRGLIGRDYTSQNYGPGKHGYYVTEEGREVCEALFGGDDV